jgi:hypothetical protein
MAETKHPGVAPHDQGKVSKGSLAEDRYEGKGAAGGHEVGASGPTVESTVPPNTAAPGSIKAEVAAEVARILTALGVTKPDEGGPRASQSAVEKSRKVLADRAKAAEEEVKAQSRYKAVADGFIPSPVPGGGGLYVRAGDEFMFSGVPGMWMEPMDARSEQRVEERQEAVRKRQEELARGAVAKSALDEASRVIDRMHQNAEGARFTPDKPREPGTNG